MKGGFVHLCLLLAILQRSLGLLSSAFKQRINSCSCRRNVAISPTSSTSDSKTKNPEDGSYDYEQWKKAFVSQPKEFDYFIPASDIDGEIPIDLHGTLFRNRPALFERGGQKYGHYLDGDGQVARVTFSSQNGKPLVHFKSKFVQTEEYMAESAVDTVLFRATFRTQRPTSPNQPFKDTICLNNAFDMKLKNAANTNVLYWGNKLLSFFEAGVPYRLDPISLDTQGPDDMNINLKSGLPIFVEKLHAFSPTLHDKLFGKFASAHPKVDTINNRLVSWVYSAVEGSEGPLKTHPLMKIYEWDDAFMPITKEITHLLPNTGIAPHDFSFTDNYHVFIENRASGDTIPYLLGTKNPAQCMDLEPLSPMMLHLVPREKKMNKEGSEQSMLLPIVLPLTPGFTIHSVCAFEKHEEEIEINGDKKDRHTLELYTTAWESSAVSSGQVTGGLLGSWEGAAPQFDDIPLTLLYKTVVDLTNVKNEANDGQEEGKETGGRGATLVSHAPVSTMEKMVIEHPHTNPLLEGQIRRYLYMSLGSLTGFSSPPVGYQRLDLVTGEKQQYFAPLHTYCEEVVVVPKKTSSTSTSTQSVHDTEDNVWILASMFDAVKNRACVGIFDGEKIQAGPVATIWMHHSLPHSLHGYFTENTFL